MLLYDQDVLSEDAIMHWNSKPNISYLAMLTPQEIRAKVKIAFKNVFMQF